jgi:NifU-like protein involved in Fe-S cluster formation
MAYGSEVRRRFASARRRDLDETDGRVATGTAEDRTLNVWIKFQMRIEDSVVDGIGYEVFGCPETIAAASLIAERLEGRNITANPDIDVHAVAAELSIPVDKLGKLLRIEDAALACLRQAGAGDWERKR